MDKAHDVRDVSLSGTLLQLIVDGTRHETDLAEHSSRIANASPEERAHFEVSPTGYGIHWPDIDEDLSIDGLLGIAHRCPVGEAAGAGRTTPSS
jgi:hypothetical protein